MVPTPLPPSLSYEGGRHHLIATSLMLRVSEGRAASITLGGLLSLYDNNGNRNNSHLKGGGDYEAAAAASERPYRPSLAPAHSLDERGRTA